MSWPAGQGPSPTLPPNQTHWDVCAVYFADLFQRFDVQGVTGNSSCFDVIGPKCIHYLTVQVQSGYLLKAGCNDLVEVPIPESCSSIYTDLIIVNLTSKHTHILKFATCSRWKEPSQFWLIFYVHSAQNCPVVLYILSYLGVSGLAICKQASRAN